MSKAEKAPEGDEAEADTGPKPSKLPLIVGLVNTIAVLAAVGMLVYTRVLYKRPPITEDGERAKIEAMKAAPTAPAVLSFINFDPLTINISPSPPNVRPQEGSNEQIAGKLHYATIGFSVQVDENRKDELDALKPLILDQFLALVGHKQFHELTSVQGRYVLKTQLIELANALALKRQQMAGQTQQDNGPLISGLFFNQFIVQ
jgi:flagellar basal body-associated protein FliL